MRTLRLAQLLFAAAAATACAGGTAEPEPPANESPVVEENLPWIQLRVGGEAGWLDVSSHFSDPDGHSLTFAAATGNPAVASVAAVGSRITVAPMGEGRTTVAVTATDPEGASARASYRVDVRGPAAGSFNIDLIFSGDPINETQAAAFERAADYWMAVLAETELTDVTLDTTPLGCGEDTAEQRMASADDLVIVANVRQTNRIGLAFGGVCRIRDQSGLPYVGRIIVSSEALGNLEQWADAQSTSGLELLENLILHEIGHVLGIGTLWGDLIAGSSSDDPHFTGPLAIAAFDDAGGADYAGGAKVPVEERIEAHWREDVFDGDEQAEVMTPTITIGASLSAITIQSLADLGYTVDVSRAHPYRLPGTDVVAGDVAGSRAGAAGIRTGAAAQGGAAVYRVGDDVLRGPVLATDADGRVVRVIPRR